LTSFEIREAPDLVGACQPIPTDIAICPDCERELFSPKDRRYLYPFINCAHCGPRFTIISDLPYDRPNTALVDFCMCDRCRSEYTDAGNRRFQAHPIACPDCGPFVELRETHSQFPTSDPRISSIEIRVSAILKARRLLREGYIVAIKGLGGFYLACDASNPYTLAELRDRKGRSDKPFAVMVADMTTVASVCHVQREEHLLLTGRERPIVLLEKKRQTTSSIYRVSELVAPNLDTLGVMLPYMPLHHLLLNQTDPVLAREPAPPILVMTCGNIGEEPTEIENKHALTHLSPLADAFLLDNRDIQIRSDDSVVKVDQGESIHVRRSRGYAPYRWQLPFRASSILAVGGDFNNTLCITHDQHALLSQHIGNMEKAEAQIVFEQSVQHLSHIFRLEPSVIAHDLQPDYFTTHYAERSALPRVEVQHHHAHIAACMAENGLDDKRVIGLAFDGWGYGTDGAVWGGEVLIASYGAFTRFAHLEYLPLVGGDSAVRAPWQIAAGYARALDIDIERMPFLQNIDKRARRLLWQQIDENSQASLSSSMGKLFDAVASIIGIRNEITYEAQGRIEMEALSRPAVRAAKSYPYLIEQTANVAVVRLRQLLAGIVRDVRANESVSLIGARFHKTLAEIAVEFCRRARNSTGLGDVVLSGGVWQNQILLDLVRDGLRQAGFAVYSHRRVPTSDSGLALGQAVVAAAQAVGSAEIESNRAIS
jgi:hydrogenase maturation protein HypF